MKNRIIRNITRYIMSQILFILTASVIIIIALKLIGPMSEYWQTAFPFMAGALYGIVYSKVFMEK